MKTPAAFCIPTTAGVLYPVIELDLSDSLHSQGLASNSVPSDARVGITVRSTAQYSATLPNVASRLGNSEAVCAHVSFLIFFLWRVAVEESW